MYHTAGSREESMSAHDSFTERELDIMRLMAQDHSNHDIAGRLALSIKTVRWYLRQIYSKLDVHSRDDALAQIDAFGLFAANDHVNGNRRHNLPAHVTGFVGREGELSEIATLLADPACRLVSLVGPGGMGKTSLALEAARFQKRHFADGVYFVACAPLSDPHDIVPAIAAALDYPLREDDRSPQQQLSGYLAHKHLLLIIDNFERLLDGATMLTDLLQAAPRLQMIATSRERLNLLPERVVTLGGLEMPENDTVEDWLRASAVKLFVQSAQRAQADFVLQAGDMDSIARICRQVGGMPLGILLAAAWVIMLTPQEIAEEIARSFDILGHDIRDLPPRHQRISAVFESSWKRLSADEQQVFMRLSVFRGGFTREAAQQVAGATLPVLNGLVNKAMLQVEPSTRRYVIQELLLQYGQSRLETAGETEATQTAHSQYFMAFMQQRTPDLKGVRQIEAYDEIEADFDNIRAAWHWAVEQADFYALNQAVEAIVVMNWHFSGTRQSIDLFQFALDHLPRRASDDPPRVWCRIHLHMLQCQDVLHTAPYERYLAEARQRQDWTEAAFCIGAMGRIALLEGDINRALQLLHESLDLWLQLNKPYYAAHDMWEIRTCYMCVGKFDLEKAIYYNQECLRIRRQINDRIGIAWCVFAISWELRAKGEYRQAEGQLHTALQQHRQVSNLFGEAYTIAELSFINFLIGDFLTADSLIDQWLELSININTTQQIGSIHSQQLRSLIACMHNNHDHLRKLLQTGMSDKKIEFFKSTDAWVDAVVAASLNDYHTAKQSMEAAFRLFEGNNAGLTWCLPVAAIIAAHEGDEKNAAELLGLAYTHPASATSWMEKWPLLTDLRKQLRDALGVKRYEQAWQGGEQLDLEVTVERLLAEKR